MLVAEPMPKSVDLMRFRGRFRQIAQVSLTRPRTSDTPRLHPGAGLGTIREDVALTLISCRVGGRYGHQTTTKRPPNDHQKQQHHR